MAVGIYLNSLICFLNYSLGVKKTIRKVIELCFVMASQSQSLLLILIS